MAPIQTGGWRLTEVIKYATVVTLESDRTTTGTQDAPAPESVFSPMAQAVAKSNTYTTD